MAQFYKVNFFAFIFTGILVSFISCRGYIQSSNAIHSKAKNCRDSLYTVDLFFDNQKPSFAYKKIVPVYVKGRDEFATDGQLLLEVKEIAKYHCGDAVINLKRGKATYENPLIYDTDSLAIPYQYYTISYRGIIVKKR
jgi:hypothetical protein